MTEITMTISGAASDEKWGTLNDVSKLLLEKFTIVVAETPSEGPFTVRFAPVKVDGFFSDMSVAACMARYTAFRARIHAAISHGYVSASMSGIEFYPCEAKSLGDHPDMLKIAMTWNGAHHIDRPNFMAEYAAWIEECPK